MPFRRKRSPYWYIELTLRGYGPTGRVSSGVEDKRIAVRMESLLRQLGERSLVEPSYAAILDAVCRDHTLSLPDLLAAHNRGHMDRLRRSVADPLIADAARAYARIDRQKPVRVGLRYLVDLTPSGARLSSLTGKRITELCHQKESDGIKRNSVRRYLLRAISKLLTHEMGRAERNRIFADVNFPAEDDTREVHLTPADIRRLLTAAESVMGAEGPALVLTALLTSADRGVLLSGGYRGQRLRGLLKKDIAIWEEAGTYSGEVYLHDTKTQTRSRTVPIPDVLCRHLMPLVRHKAPEDCVFSLAYRAFDYRWKQVRKAAELPGLRFKDLRSQTAIHGELAGIALTTVQRTMGHADAKMTRRYMARQAAMSQAEAERIAAQMGLTGS